MKQLLFFLAFSTTLAFAAPQDEHKFVFAGQESEAFTLNGGIWSKGDGPETEYCHDEGVRYEDDCRNRTRTRRLCHSGDGGCWEESYEEYSCEPRAIHWGSSTPCGTLNGDSKWIKVTAPVTVAFPKNGPKDGIDFTATFEDKGVFKLTPGLLPAGIIATVAATVKDEPQKMPNELKRAVHFDVRFRTVKDFLAETVKKITRARVDKENRRLYLTFDGMVASSDLIYLNISAEIGYRNGRLNVIGLSGKPSGEFTIKNDPTETKLLSKLSRDPKGKLVLELDMNPMWSTVSGALRRSPFVEATITKVLDPGAEWFGVTADLKQVFTVPLK